MSLGKPLFLPEIPDFFTVCEVEECGSTNTLLKERAGTLPEGFVLIARRQSAGRGRLGRRFFSPDATGLYLSILLRPALSPADAALLTPAAAVAAARAVDGCFGVETKIKWVNDLYLRGKKICGILAESSYGGGSSPAYTVLGAGFNIAPPEGGFPADIAEVAGAIAEKAAPGDRERLAGAFLRELYGLYTALPATPFYEEYRARDLVCGRDVTVLSPDGSTPAHAEEILPDFSLAVRLPDGTRRALAAGEVSLRGWA